MTQKKSVWVCVWVCVSVRVCMRTCPCARAGVPMGPWLAWRPHALVRGAGLAACLLCGQTCLLLGASWAGLESAPCPRVADQLPRRVAAALLGGAFDAYLGAEVLARSRAAASMRLRALRPLERD